MTQQSKGWSSMKRKKERKEKLHRLDLEAAQYEENTKGLTVSNFDIVPTRLAYNMNASTPW